MSKRSVVVVSTGLSGVALGVILWMVSVWLFVIAFAIAQPSPAIRDPLLNAVWCLTLWGSFYGGARIIASFSWSVAAPWACTAFYAIFVLGYACFEGFVTGDVAENIWAYGNLILASVAVFVGAKQGERSRPQCS